MRFCEVCQSTVGENSNFCKECGNQMPPPAPPQQYSGYHGANYQAQNYQTQNYQAPSHHPPNYHHGGNPYAGHYAHPPVAKRTSGALIAVIAVVVVLIFGLAVFFIARAVVFNGPTTPGGGGPVAGGELTRDSSLVGTWMWMGSPYYVFEANGTGTMPGFNLNWWTSGGILFICTTPGLCGSNCLNPTEWDYEIVGNTLTLTGRGLLRWMTFTYTRG